MLRKHCSDELLVAHLDRELGGRAKRHVEEHLAACWQCRARAAELESAIHSLTKACSELDYPGPDWIVEARLRFAEARRQIDREQPSAGLWASLFPGRAVLAAAMASLLLVAVAGTWLLRRRPLESARGLVTQVEAEERQAFGQPVRLLYDVQIVALKPAGTPLTARLEVCSDSASHRFSFRWWDSQGSMRHAVWRPGAGKEFVLEPASAVAVAVDDARDAASVSIADLAGAGLDQDQVARAFVRWLRSRHWEPVSFAPDARSFADSTGVILRMERLESGSGRVLVRLTAERQIQGMNVRITMDVEPDSYRPVVQRIRFERGSQALELRMTTQAFQVVPQGQFQLADFTPPLPSAPRAPNQAARTVLAPRPVEPSELQPTRLDATTQATREIEALYALHRIGACRTESLEVVPADSGWPVVRGVVRDEDRKRAITDALLQLPWSSHLGLQIQTTAEAMSSAATPSAQKPGDESVALFSPISGGRLPIEDVLRNYLRQSGASVDSQIARFAANQISRANMVFADSWALRRLAEKTAERDGTSLPPSVMGVVDTMLHDHLTSLQRGRRDLGAALEPLFREVSPQGMSGEVAPAPTTLPDAILRGNVSAQRVLSEVNFLFAGARDPNVPEETATLAAGHLLRDLRQLEDSNRIAADILSRRSAAARR